MNNTIYFNSETSDDKRRQQLYDGQLFVFSPRKSILDFVGFARSMIEDGFGDLDPRTAQDRMEVESYADLLGKLKPGFIHHPEIETSFAGNPRRFGMRPGEDLPPHPEEAAFDRIHDLMRNAGYCLHEIVGIIRRPLDGAMTHFDAVYVKTGSPLRSDRSWGS